MVGTSETMWTASKTIRYKKKAFIPANIRRPHFSNFPVTLI